ncbi:iron-containing alcohol dehydrogenase [Myxococcota bacterium]|nr:iron-containing alcohol dehydrogenase [Myxococcota bacterium]MBU1510750.1 iron-containing alcohol dehydrogenase [Myxococcota bacterium]
MKKALILAAGRGKRLDRKSKPKPLVEVGNRPILMHVIEGLAAVGVEEFHIVVGFDRDRIVREVTSRVAGQWKLNFIDNTSFDGGLAHSVLCGREALDEPFILSMGDHLFDGAHFARIAASPPEAGGVTVLVHHNPPTEKATSDSVKVRGENGRVKAIGTDLTEFGGVDMGLFSCDPSGLFPVLAEAIATAPDATLAEALQRLAGRGKLTCLKADDAGWDDIDTPVDLIRAEMRLRDQARAGVLSHVILASTKVPDAVHDFVVGEPVTTKMVMMRGFFDRPEGFEFIPRESASSPIFVFSDETVTPLYAAPLFEKMRSMGYNAHLITMPDGETSKSLASFVELTERVLRLGVDERAVFVSVGGGVVCNVCGFIASCIYRGLNLVHLPTSLMAQCDAAISHKQAINGAFGKNMVGSYYSPRMVIVDVNTLRTLPARLIHDGLAEVLKHALCQEPDYVEYLMAYEGDCVRDIDFLEKVVSKNVRLKCELVHQDPKEHTVGMVMQYGHTLGHPVEHMSGYQLYHGESVAIGMIVAARVSRILNICGEELVKAHVDLCAKFGLPTTIPAGITVDGLMEALKYNKRYLTEGTQMSLLTDIGRPWAVNGRYVIPVTNGIIREAIEQTMGVQA